MILILSVRFAFLTYMAAPRFSEALVTVSKNLYKRNIDKVCQSLSATTTKSTKVVYISLVFFSFHINKSL